MGRLKQIPQRIGRMPSRLRGHSPATEAERSRQRRDVMPWRSWYSTAQWRRLRWSILERDLFTCRKCGRPEADTSRLVADHVQPHRGDAALFWDETNIQCLCKRCHDVVKQAEERALR